MSELSANSALRPVVVALWGQTRPAWLGAVPYLLLLLALGLTSAAAAIIDPLSFVGIFATL